MNKLMLTVLVLFFMGSFHLDAQNRLVVVEWQVRSFRTNNQFGEDMAAIFKTSLIKSGQFTVMDEVLLLETLASDFEVENGIYAGSSLEKIGTSKDVEFLVIGNALELNGIFILHSQILDIQTGQVKQKQRVWPLE